MLRKISFFLAFFVLFALTITYSQTLMESQTTVYNLSNGMKIILKEKHASPMTASMIYVNAGSKYETDFNNGVTHFLEHLLFDGTKKRSREDITEGIKQRGGYINAFTRKDLTCYMVLMPKDFIEFGLDVQSDMLFNSIFPDSELAKERKVVIEEIKKDEDNIDSQLEDFFASLAYRGTPYTRTVLGYENIISIISKQEIIDYYHTYYKPNNMLALLIGDFDTEKMIELMEKYFGGVAAKPLPPQKKIEYIPPLESSVSYREADTKNTYLSMSFPAPHFSDPDFFAFVILNEILNSGETSPLYQALTSEEYPLAIDISSDLDMQKEFSALNLYITTDSPDKVELILETTRDVLRSFSWQAVEEDFLQRIIVSQKTNDYYLEERLHFYGMLKAPVLVNAGYDFLESYIDQLEFATPKKIQKVAQRYFSDPKYIATVLTSKKEKKETEEKENKSVYRKEILASGLTLIIKSNPDSRVLGINVLGKNRSASEPEGKTGIADFTNRMLLKGTLSRNAERISSDLATIGAEITLVDNPYIPYDDLYTSPLFTFIKFQTIDEFADEGIEILADIVKNPSFPEDEIEKVRKEMIGLLKRSEGSTYQEARKLYYSELFKDHPYGRSPMGDMESLNSITQKDLIEFHQRFYSAGNIIITVATNLSPEEIVEKIDRKFSDISQVEFIPPEIPKIEPLTSQVLAEKEMQKEQVYIYLGGVLPGNESPDKEALVVMNSILSSRLGLNLREKQGLAYSVGSSINLDKEFGWYIVSMGTQPENYQTALNGIKNQIQEMKNSMPTDEELEKAKNGIWGRMLMYRLSRINQAYWMGVNEFQGLGYDYDEYYIDKIKTVTREDVKRVAQSYLDTENYVLAVVGKKLQ
ncbi:MAG: pitrilysin family protein [Candidatus Zixiibacteriota bacterium]